MNTYIRLHVEGLLQSWGTYVPGKTRGTEAFPTKSGILGILSAACGHQRGDSRSVQLHHHCRVSARNLRVGPIHQDYHIVQGCQASSENVKWGDPKVVGTDKKGGIFHSSVMHGDGDSVISTREYLEDACFEVVVEVGAGSPHTAEDLIERLRRPLYPLYLGRKTCFPKLPVVSPESMPVKAESPDAVFRMPTKGEVGILMKWADDEDRYATWYGSRYKAGMQYLDVPHAPSNTVPYVVWDQLVDGSNRVFGQRTLYVKRNES